jgi:hypothetical protein
LRIESQLGPDHCQAIDAVWRRFWDALNGPTWIEARLLRKAQWMPNRTAAATALPNRCVAGMVGDGIGMEVAALRKRIECKTCGFTVDDLVGLIPHWVWAELE